MEQEYINSVAVSGTIWSIKESGPDKIFIVINQRLKRVGSKCYNFFGCLLRGEGLQYAREELLVGDQILVKGRIGNWKSYETKSKYKVMIIRASELTLLKREDTIPNPWKFNDAD